MAQSSDPRNFFETDAEQSKRERRALKSTNSHGAPIILKSKLLALHSDPTSPSQVFLAESAGTVRRLDLTTSTTTALYRGPTAPVTCVTLGGRDNRTVFAGCWDKSIWYWSLDDPKTVKGRCVGHADFVKAVVCATLADGRPVLVSGSADRKIMVWDLSGEGEPKRLHTLKDVGAGGLRGGMLAVQDLAVIDAPEGEDEKALWLVSASSDPQVRTWKITSEGWEQVVSADVDGGDASMQTKAATAGNPAHETTVYSLHPDPEGTGDLWTASADGTAKRLAYENNEFKVEEALAHGEHVRAVTAAGPWIVTAGRDEDLRFWDRATGELFATVTGHYDEVTGLLALGGQLVSVSIDGTVRRWPLGKAEMQALVELQAKEARGEGPGEDDEEKAKTGKEESGMTADEEAELAALMEDD